MKYTAPVAEKLSVEAINVLLVSGDEPVVPGCTNLTPIICEDD